MILLFQFISPTMKSRSVKQTLTVMKDILHTLSCYKEEMVGMVVMVQLDLQDYLVRRERKETLELRESLDTALGESPTSGGVEPPAPTLQELN